MHRVERRSAIPANFRATRPDIFILLLCLLILAPRLSFAEEDLLKDDLFMGTWLLSAERFSYDYNSGILKADGNVRLESESSDDVLVFREGTFNPRDKTGEMTDGILYLSGNDFLIQGETIKKASDDTYSINDFQLTTCDNDPPSWSITGSEINISVGGYGTLKNAAFRVRDIPVFYLPYMIFPAKTKRQTGLLIPQFDRSDMNGYGIEQPFFWAISDRSDFTFYERYMSERGLMHGLEFRYASGDGSKGEILLDILKDEIEEKDLSDKDQAEITPFERTNQTRYWLRGRLDQDLSSYVTSRLDLDLVSDQDYLREFSGEFVGLESRPDLAEDFGRPADERYSSFRTSALRISRDGEDYSLQGSGYYYQPTLDQEDDEISQPLAGIFYSILPEKISRLPFFFSADTEYNYLWQDEGVTGHSISINPEISYPRQLGEYLKLDSSLGYTGNLEAYDDPYNDTDTIVKDAYQATIELSTILERIFAPGGQEATRLKHKITPAISYVYRVLPEDQDESPWFNPIDYGSKTNMIGISVENILDASLTDEKGGVSYRQWAKLDITQEYDLDMLRRNDIADDDKEVWAPLLTTLTLRPLNAINLKASSTWDHYEDRISTTVLSLDLSVKRSEDSSDKYSVDYVKYDDDNRSLNLNTDFMIAGGFSAGVLLNRDLDLGYNINRSLWLKYNARCWSLKLGIEEEDADREIIVKFQVGGF